MLHRTIPAALAIVTALAAPRATAAGVVDSSSESVRPKLGLIVAAVGMAGFATSVFIGRERSNHDNASARCTVDVCASMASLLVEDARSQSNTAFRLMGLSAAALFSGVALVLTSPEGTTSTRPFSGARVTLGSSGITFTTTF